MTPEPASPTEITQCRSGAQVCGVEVRDPFEDTGKTMKSWCLLVTAGVKQEKQLRKWREIGRDFDTILPAE